MKKLSEHQIVSILKETEVDIPIKVLCRKYTMTVFTFYKNGGINMVVCNLRILSG